MRTFGPWICRALALTTVLVVGCYSPHIAPGGYRCGDGGACPSGYRCAADHRCYSDSVDAKLDLPATCDSTTSLAPVCSVNPASGQACNPGCQTGCGGCGWCAIVGGTATCLHGTEGTKDVGQLCDPGKASDCKADLYCQPACGRGRCYRLCDSTLKDSDPNFCGAGSSCSVAARRPEVDGGAPLAFSLCSLVETCDAIKQTCPTGFACYPIGNETECDCPGTTPDGQGCGFIFDCRPGSSCIGTGSGTNICLQSCTASTVCATGSCQNPAGTTYGYCD